MSKGLRFWRFLYSLLFPLLLTGCGGGGGGGGPSPNNACGIGMVTSATSYTLPPAPAVAANQSLVTVMQYNNPAINYVTLNLPYVTVTLCDQSTPQHCQNIDHVILDTGSYGLRVLASTLSSNLQLTHTTLSGQNLAECATFVNSFDWGWVYNATVALNGESTVQAVPIQVIDDQNQLAVPSSCSNNGGSNTGSVYGLGGNGILGVGPFVSDPGPYYQCTTAGSCTSAAPPTTSMVSNPVAFFPTDNNGVIVQLPAISNTGAPSTYGTITYGINTQTNNSISSGFTALQEDVNGNFTASLSGTAYPNSFVDTGSNRNYLNLPTATPTNCEGDYIPAVYTAYSGALSPSAGTTSTGSTVASTNFSIAVMDPTNSIAQGMTALNDITDPGLLGTAADLGLPFFFGQSVALVMSGKTVTAGTGPIVAFRTP